jgi:hypothetical protein
MKSWLQKLLLTLFVLLQCASPLVHAHIESVDSGNHTAASGLNSPVHLHFDGMATVASAYDLSADTETSQTHLKKLSSPQVSMPQVNVRSEYSFDHDVAIIDVVVTPRATLPALPIWHSFSPVLRPAIHHFSAWSQAPPAPPRFA